MYIPFDGALLNAIDARASSIKQCVFIQLVGMAVDPEPVKYVHKLIRFASLYAVLEMFYSSVW